MTNEQFANFVERLSELVSQMKQAMESPKSDDVKEFSQSQYEQHLRDGLCLRCSQSLAGTPRPRRGVHEACYQYYVRNKAIDSAVASRRLMPKSKPGKKASDAIPPAAEVLRDTLAIKKKIDQLTKKKPGK